MKYLHFEFFSSLESTFSDMAHIQTLGFCSEKNDILLPLYLNNQILVLQTVIVLIEELRK